MGSFCEVGSCIRGTIYEIKLIRKKNTLYHCLSSISPVVHLVRVWNIYPAAAKQSHMFELHIPTPHGAAVFVCSVFWGDLFGKWKVCVHREDTLLRLILSYKYINVQRHTYSEKWPLEHTSSSAEKLEQW